MAKLRDFNEEDKATLVECVYILEDGFRTSRDEIAEQTGLIIDTVRECVVLINQQITIPIALQLMIRFILS